MAEHVFSCSLFFYVCLVLWKIQQSAKHFLKEITVLVLVNQLASEAVAGQTATV